MVGAVTKVTVPLVVILPQNEQSTFSMRGVYTNGPGGGQFWLKVANI